MSARDPQTRIAELERELHWAQLRIQVLEERLRERRIALLGPRSETLSNLQLELLADEEPGVTAAVIGYDESEQLDVEPARYFVRVTKREKRACRCCDRGTVVAAPLEARIVEKGLASNEVVIATVVSKYCDYVGVPVM